MTYENIRVVCVMYEFSKLPKRIREFHKEVEKIVKQFNGRITTKLPLSIIAEFETRDKMNGAVVRIILAAKRLNLLQRFGGPRVEWIVETGNYYKRRVR